MQELRRVTGRRQWVAFGMVLLAGSVGTVLAADPVDEALSTAGKAWYEKYCTPCHGPGGAPGTAVSQATRTPVDLRGYVQAPGGKFPAADWLAVIADARPGGPHAAVWEDIKKAQAGSVQNDVAARGVLGSIARYVQSIQAK